MIKLELLRKELIGKEVNIQEMEDLVGFIYDFDDKDSIFNENLYLAFENMCHSYEILNNDFKNETCLNISFKADINKDTGFDVYEDKILITEIEYIYRIYL